MNASQGDGNRIEFGSHVITAEPNGVLHLLIRGRITTQHAEQIKNAMSSYGKLHPAYSLIVIVTDMTGIDGEARRAFVTPDTRYPYGCLYFVGASFTIRTIISGVQRARRILMPSVVTGLTITVDSEEEARRLIAAHQREKRHKH